MAAFSMVAIGSGLMATAWLLSIHTENDIWRAVDLSVGGATLCGAGLLKPFNRAVLGAIIGFFLAAVVAARLLIAVQLATAD